jgi:hypothetical protein
MSERDDDGERPKKSWRELDRMRDRSKHVGGAKPAEAPRERERSKMSRTALDRAFTDGLVGKLVAAKEGGSIPEDKSKRPELLKKIRISESRAEVNAAIDELLAFSDFPDDWDVLIRALDHDKSDVLQRALTRLAKLLETERPPRRGALLQRVIGLAENADEDEVRELATKLRQTLGG